MRLRLVTFLMVVFWGVCAQAQQKPVVVELFTSQGCSSCPPADALLRELSHRDDVLALSLHVDYWDYIGWKDVFGSPKNTERQRHYAHVAGRDMVYTPQMIINGTTDVVGSRVEDVTNAIRKELAKPGIVQVTATRKGANLVITAQALSQPTGPLRVQLVRYQPSASVQIERGENAGHRLDYTNVVYDLDTIGSWDGQGPLEMSVKIKDDLPAAVLLQKPDLGPIMASAVAQ